MAQGKAKEEKMMKYDNGRLEDHIGDRNISPSEFTGLLLRSLNAENNVRYKGAKIESSNLNGTTELTMRHEYGSVHPRFIAVDISKREYVLSDFFIPSFLRDDVRTIMNRSGYNEKSM
ncbi:hypothetical protein J4406_00950 [Candidatus Woesearchaeota archaeon]|nr:hypothetical protein [Candidatus Woesearchaeota archaeon]